MYNKEVLFLSVIDASPTKVMVAIIPQSEMCCSSDP